MARNEYDDQDGDEFEDGSNLVRDLRKQLKDALKQNTELNEQVKTLNVQTRKASLADVLKSQNLSPKLAAFYPGEGEVTPEAVTAWVTEYADVFGVQVETAKTSNTEVPNVDAEQAAIFQRISQTDTPQPQARMNDAASRIAAAKSTEELLSILSGLSA